MTFMKSKKGGLYVVTWDSDASSSDDDNSDDDKTTKKKALASIAINEKPSLFDTPSCLMAKPLRYKLVMMEVMRNMIMKMKVIVMMMNQLRMNYLICQMMLKNTLTLREGNAKACIRN